MIESKRSSSVLPSLLIGGVVILFWVVYPLFPNSSTSFSRLVPWMADAWRGDFLHGWAVPFIFVFFVWRAIPKMREESCEMGKLGLFPLIFGILLFLLSVRSLQPRVALAGIPFLIIGSVYFVSGFRVVRHLIVPSFFWYFAITVPGLQQATNALQIIVTKSCYFVGSNLGMELVNAGNTISSATDSWQFDIAEGCSGIRSVMALVMIAAIYAYLTQKSLWKMAILFASSLPLALIANFFRIFTILVLAEGGMSDFAAGAYHDWAGLLFFFPICLIGLFTLDRVLNWKASKRVIKRRIQD